MLSFSLSPFIFIKRLFSSSLLSPIRVVSSVYLRLLMFLPAILIPACASSSLARALKAGCRVSECWPQRADFCCCSVSYVVSDSLWPHELRHTRLTRHSLSPRVCSDSCPLCQWCHPTVSSSDSPFSACPQCFPASRSFSSESALHVRWPKY